MLYVKVYVSFFFFLSTFNVSLDVLLSSKILFNKLLCFLLAPSRVILPLNLLSTKDQIVTNC